MTGSVLEGGGDEEWRADGLVCRFLSSTPPLGEDESRAGATGTVAGSDMEPFLTMRKKKKGGKRV